MVKNKKESGKRDLIIGKKSNSQSCFDNFVIVPKSNRSTHAFNQTSINYFPDSKRSQITIFIILAICIVMVLLLLFTQKSDFVAIFSKQSPVAQIQQCLETPASEGLTLISNQGGELDPKNFYLYDGNKVDYLCYTNQYYKPCVMQKPVLKKYIEDELKNYIENNSVGCIEAVKKSLQSQGYSVYMKKPVISVELIPNNVKISADIDLQLTKETTEAYKSIKTEISSNIYDLIFIAMSIANWEARYGDSETMNYMYFHPELKVEKKTRDEGTRIYILTNRESLDKFVFATRSYARPAGLTGN